MESGRSRTGAAAQPWDAGSCGAGKGKQQTDGRYILDIELTASGIQRTVV